MKIDSETMQIPMQVGSEIRINNFGEVAIGNPELVLANEPQMCIRDSRSTIRW